MKTLLFLITISFCYGQELFINKYQISKIQTIWWLDTNNVAHINTEIVIPEILKLWSDYKEQNYEIRYDKFVVPQRKTDSTWYWKEDSSYVKRKKYNSIDGFMEYLKKRVK